jgi:ABC-type Fe3+/spermidine/putrescine transport system ATPase subunit
MNDVPAVQVRSVSKVFGDTVTAVNAVSLEIAAGEFFALLGPSGCGKTTLLRMIAGLESPTVGRILVAGEDVTDLPPHRRPVNLVFQHYALFPHLSVEQNVGFGLRYHGVRGADAHQRVTEALDLVQLPGYGARKPDQLSGGQRQRVALARAIVLRPKVLLLDEPLGALDQKLRREMQLELKRLQRALGITFVFVTHDQEEAMTMSDRIAVMNGGNVEQLDTAEQVFERPRTRFVAEFMGAANFLSDGTRRFIVRPEKLRLSNAPIAGLSCIEVTVDERSYQGLSTVWTLRAAAAAAEGTTLIAYEQNVGVASDVARFAVGDRAFACWHASHAVELDDDGGGGAR